MKNTLHFIVASLVDKPSDVKIEEESVDGTLCFIIKAAKEDIGKIIGKEGKIIRSIRNVMKIPAIKQNIRINVTIADPDETK